MRGKEEEGTGRQTWPAGGFCLGSAFSLLGLSCGMLGGVAAGNEVVFRFSLLTPLAGALVGGMVDVVRAIRRHNGRIDLEAL